jgi:hypothetical protein
MNKMLQAADNIGGVPLGRAIATDIFNGGMKQQATLRHRPRGPVSSYPELPGAHIAPGSI